MNARTSPPCAALLLTALLVGACEERAPIPVTYVPQAPRPASAGTPEEQAARQLDRALAQDARRDRARAANPAAIGNPAPGPDLEIGGGDGPQAAPQFGIPLR
jgi:hypothetical protein